MGKSSPVHGLKSSSSEHHKIRNSVIEELELALVIIAMVVPKR